MLLALARFPWPRPRSPQGTAPRRARSPLPGVRVGERPRAAWPAARVSELGTVARLLRRGEDFVHRSPRRGGDSPPQSHLRRAARPAMRSRATVSSGSSPSAARTESTELPRSIRTTAPADPAASRSAPSTRPPSVPNVPSGPPPAATIGTLGPATWATSSARPSAIAALWETSTRPTKPFRDSPVHRGCILQCRTPFDNTHR